jgi:hypothetical protein
MRKTTKDTTKFSNDGLAATFMGLEEALMADTVQLKAIDEDIKTLTTKLKKLSFDETGTTICANGIKAGRVGYDYDKKIILFARAEGGVAQLLNQSPAVRREVYNTCLDELLVHLRQRFEARAKPVNPSNATTLNVSQPQKSAGLFSRQA